MRTLEGRKTALMLAVAAMAVGGMAGRASAGVIDYSVFKAADFNQSSPDAPTTAYDYRLDANIRFENASDAGSVLFQPTGDNPPVFMQPQANNSYFFRNGAATADELDLLYPTGAASFTVSGGTLDGASSTFMIPDTAYPMNIPALVPTSFTALQSITDVSKPISLVFSDYPEDETLDSQTVFFTIVDNTTNTTVFDENGDQSALSGADVAGGTFTPGDSYTFTLFFSNRLNNLGDGFDGAFNFMGFDYATNGSFTVPVPEPTAVMAMLPLVLAGLGRRSRR